MERGIKATREQILAINAKALYFTDYTIDNNGNRINKSGVVEGGFLTVYQIPTAERIQ